MPKYNGRVNLFLDVIINTEEEDFKDWLADMEIKSEDVDDDVVHDYIASCLENDTTHFGDPSVNDIEVQKPK